MKKLALPLAAVALLVSVSPVSAAPRPSRICDFLDQAVCLQPWPNDYFRKDGRIALSQRAMPAAKDGKRIDPAGWNRNDGFSPGQTIITRVPGLDNARAFRKTNPVALRDLSRYTAGRAPILVIDTVTGKRHPIWAELDPNPKRRADVNLQVRPARNWLEGRRYVVALRNLKNAKGRVLRAGAAFRLYRDGTKTSNRLIEGRRAHMNSIFRTLRRAGVRRRSLYLAWDFTVASRQNLTERALHMRDDAFALLGDTSLADGQVQGTAPPFAVTKVEAVDGEPGVAQRIEGTFQVPCYLEGPGCGPGAGFTYASAESNIPVRTADNFRTAPFWCNVPQEAGPSKPALAVQYGHGLLGSGAQVYSESDIQRMAERHNAMYCATNWTGMDSEGIPFAVQVLENLSLFPKFADRLQQGLLDQLYLGRLMIHPQGLASHEAFQQGNKPFFDNTKLLWDSNSQGGIMGGALTALAPDFRNAVLGVPAMNYSVLLRRSVDFDSYAVVMYRKYTNERDRPLVLGLMQMVWDRGETNGYAQHVVGDPLPGSPDHKVLMHVAIGDHQVTTIQADVMARTLGARVRQPAIDEGRSNELKPLFGIPPIGGFPFTGNAAMVYWDTGPARTVDGAAVGTSPAPLAEVPNRTGADPHGRPRKDLNAQRQKVEFMLEGRVIDVCGSFSCYVDGYAGP
jgi:hypothetical protein